MKSLLLTTLLFTAFVQSANAEFKFAKAVPADQKKTITKDMFYLANQPFPADARLMQLMDLKSSDGLTILNWIDNRVSYIVDEDFNLEGNIAVINQSYFPQPSEKPDIPTNAKTPDSSGGKVQTVMSNAGAGVYVAGKLNNVMFSLKIDDKNIAMSSPRSGVLKVGSGLFSTKAMIGSASDSIVSRFYRLETLVHEARHSDGRGKSAGFLHSVCTSGRLEGYAGCDANSNGPYSIGAQFMKVAAQNCKECQPGELELMNKIVADSFSRVSAPATQSVDAQLSSQIISSYQMLLSLCTKAPGSCSKEDVQKYQASIASAQAQLAGTQGTAPQAPAWDANPEGTFNSVTRDQTWANIYQLNQQAK